MKAELSLDPALVAAVERFIWRNAQRSNRVTGPLAQRSQDF
jgi:hypothetical protein